MSTTTTGEGTGAIAMNQTQAAKALGMSNKTLQRLTKSGEIVPSKIGRTLLLYSVESLKAFLESKRVGGEKAATDSR